MVDVTFGLRGCRSPRPGIRVIHPFAGGKYIITLGTVRIDKVERGGRVQRRAGRVEHSSRAVGARHPVTTDHSRRPGDELAANPKTTDRRGDRSDTVRG